MRIEDIYGKKTRKIDENVSDERSGHFGEEEEERAYISGEDFDSRERFDNKVRYQKSFQKGSSYRRRESDMSEDSDSKEEIGLEDEEREDVIEGDEKGGVDKERIRGLGIPKFLKISLGVFGAVIVFLFVGMAVLYFLGGEKKKSTFVAGQFQQDQPVLLQQSNQSAGNQSIVEQSDNKSQSFDSVSGVSASDNQSSVTVSKGVDSGVAGVQQKQEHGKELSQKPVVIIKSSSEGKTGQGGGEDLKKQTFERDIFKEFYVTRERGTGQHVISEGKKKTSKTSSSAESSILSSPLPPVLPPASVSGTSVGVETKSLTLYGIVCEGDGKCEAITSIGVFKEGDAISPVEKVLKVERERLVTNLRILQ